MALGGLYLLPPEQRGARAAEAVPTGFDPFALGVASGMPAPTSVLLWTRLAPRPLEPGGGMPPAPVAVRWELADDEGFQHLRQSGQVWAQPENAHAVHLPVQGLPPGRVYFYRFMTPGAVSPVGRTRTAPAADAEVLRLRLALASCQHYEQGWFSAHRDIAEQDLDAVMFVGDYIYEASRGGEKLRRHDAPKPTTLDGYRIRHALYRLDPDLRAAHAAHPWLLTWDDHDVENDYAGDASAFDHSPQAFLALKAAGYKAWFEHLPLSPAMAPRGARMALSHQLSWGRLADLWLLDNRQFRDVQACNPPGEAGGRLRRPRCTELASAQRTMFGPAQEQWLMQGLAHSPRRWKVMGQSTQMSPSGFDTPMGRAVYSDGWDGYPAARERLLDHVAQAGVENLLVLGGDVHRHVAAQLRVRPNDSASPVVGSELVTSSISSGGLPDAAMLLMRRSNPDLVHARSDERGHALIEITPSAVRCEFRGVAHPVRAEARCHTQARVVVQAGRAGVEPEA